MAKSSEPIEVSGVRLDRWLWAARFFKTRSLSAEAIKGGHVTLNGVRAKVSRMVRVDDEIHVRKGQELFMVRVRGLAEKRGPAVQAQALYEESEESRQAREQQSQQRRLLAQRYPRSEGRPSKRNRRQIIRFVRQQDE